MDPVLFIAAAEADTSNAREDSFMGRDFFVVPVVAIVEGVLHAANATDGPELALASEFGRQPAGWNGRPVTMGHPKINETMVSANFPDVLEEFQMGFLFNTRLDGNKLKTEAWIDIDRVNEVGGDFADTLQRLRDNEMVEVSVGIFTESERASGTYNGERYNGVWRNCVPDHLALLHKGTKGACSIEDGCGAPRVNQSQLKGVGNHTHTHSHEDCGCGGTEGSCSCQTKPKGAKMPTRALYEKALGVLANSLPDSMIDRDARAALSQAVMKQYGSYSWLIAFTRDSAIFMDYEGGYLRVNFDMDDDGNVKFTSEPEEVRLMTRVVAVNGDEAASDEPAANSSGEETGTEAILPLSAEGGETASGETTEEVEVSSSEETTARETQMSDNANADAAAAADGTRKETTESQTPAAPEASAPENQPAAAASASASTPTPAEPKKPVTAEEYIAAAPSEIREVLDDGLRAYQSKKNGLIANLKSTDRCGFTDDELNAMSVQQLEKLAKLANAPSYEAAAIPTNHSSAEADDNRPPAPLLVFENKPAAAANG